MMVQVYQRASHHNRHNRVFHIGDPPGTLMTTPLDTPVDVPGERYKQLDIANVARRSHALHLVAVRLYIVQAVLSFLAFVFLCLVDRFTVTLVTV